MAVAMAVVSAGTYATTDSLAEAKEPTPSSFRDFQYGEGSARPTADKPQSKLWYAYGSWWGVLAGFAGTDSRPGDPSIRIFQLMPDHRWRDTGTVVDSRPTSTADVLWDGDELYVASRDASSPLEVSRLSFDVTDQEWSRDGGFPVRVAGGSQSATIAKDSTGTLWVTYTAEGLVWVTHTKTSEREWTTPFQPAVPDPSVTADDLSSVVSFGDRIGVMWSNQRTNDFWFAVHADGADDADWSLENAASGFFDVDDHIYLTTAATDSGTQVLAAVKTSLSDVSGVPATSQQISVLVRAPNGNWSTVPAGTVGDGHSRPILVVDNSNQELYLVAAAAGSGIYYKRSQLGDISFADGRGDALIPVGEGVVEDATSTKAPVTAETGLVVLAAANISRTYFHAEVALDDRAVDTGPPQRPPVLEGVATEGCQVQLVWPPATDDVEVSRYVLERNGVELASTTSNQHTDTSAECEKRYRYAVSAIDSSGNRSGSTTSAPVTTPDAIRRDSGIWLRSASAAANDGGESITLRPPPSQPGDVLLASIDAVGAATITAPAGWELIRRDVAGGVMTKMTFALVASGKELSAQEWTLGGAHSAVANLLVYVGADASAPIASATGRVNGTSLSITTPNVDAQVPGAAVVGLFGVAGLVAITPPPEMVGHMTQGNTIGPHRVTGSTAELLGADGPTGTFVATASRRWLSIGQLVVLQPAAQETK